MIISGCVIPREVERAVRQAGYTGGGSPEAGAREPCFI